MSHNVSGHRSGRIIFTPIGPDVLKDLLLGNSTSEVQEGSDFHQYLKRAHDVAEKGDAPGTHDEGGLAALAGLISAISALKESIGVTPEIREPESKDSDDACEEKITSCKTSGCAGCGSDFGDDTYSSAELTVSLYGPRDVIRTLLNVLESGASDEIETCRAVYPTVQSSITTSITTSQ